ncbi:MAG TPA: HAMP domain-containing sensor histidine kinase [Chloroflexota bacterium]|nr:HAMP domain-containing sensor histidine kinase [Chloroflexota bacterium]
MDSATTRAEVLALSQLRDHLVASASHDLKTPLAAIRLLTHLIDRDASQGSVDLTQLRQRVGQIEANASRMSGLIAELQDVARLQGGRSIELHPSRTDLVALANKVARNFDMMEAAHRVTVTAEQPQLIGRWDAERLERVLTNLVANAVKYSAGIAGGGVVVRVGTETRRGREQAAVAVEDNGIGIPASDLPRVFDWFHRGENVGNSPGSGVGLASAKLIVEAHGGSISVSSRVGQGTKVRLRLPLEAPEREVLDLTPRAVGQPSASLG